MTIEQIQEQIRALPDEEVDQLGVWIYGDERERRSTLKAVEEAQAEVVKELQNAGKLPLPDALTDAEKPADFKTPTGAHDAYAKGTKVTYNGAVYESLIDANAYNPDAYPQGWKKIS